MAARHLSRRRIAGLSVVGAVAFLAIVVWAFLLLVGGGSGRNPFQGYSLYVYPSSSAAVATSTASGESASAFRRIASTPTAVWLTPEKHGTATIRSFVDGIVTRAVAENAVPVFVVYGIPDRDCSNESAGGTTAADYPRWVAAIASGIARRHVVVILEPDSLSLAQECGGPRDRVRLLGQAIDALEAGTSDTAIYLDGGHSTWLSAEDQAALLVEAHISRVRGFASNVANYNTTDAEAAYDEKISSLTGGARYVIDVGRNGNGTDGDWCNPSGRSLGANPAIVDDGSKRDADLWIKNPGESDGTCNGGPAAGEWWPAGALALASN